MKVFPVYKIINKEQFNKIVSEYQPEEATLIIPLRGDYLITKKPNEKLSNSMANLFSDLYYNNTIKLYCFLKENGEVITQEQPEFKEFIEIMKFLSKYYYGSIIIEFEIKTTISTPVSCIKAINTRYIKAKGLYNNLIHEKMIVISSTGDEVHINQPPHSKDRIGTTSPLYEISHKVSLLDVVLLYLKPQVFPLHCYYEMVKIYDLQNTSLKSFINSILNLKIPKPVKLLLLPKASKIQLSSKQNQFYYEVDDKQYKSLKLSWRSINNTITMNRTIKAFDYLKMIKNGLKTAYEEENEYIPPIKIPAKNVNELFQLSPNKTKKPITYIKYKGLHIPIINSNWTTEAYFNTTLFSLVILNKILKDEINYYRREVTLLTRLNYGEDYIVCNYTLHLDNKINNYCEIDSSKTLFLMSTVFGLTFHSDDDFMELFINKLKQAPITKSRDTDIPSTTL